MGKRQYTAEYKAKVVLEVLLEEKHLSEIASRENLSRTQLQNWKREFIENAALVFAQNKVEKDAKQRLQVVQEREDDLMKKVGQLTIENDWLKKKSAQLLGHGWEEKTGFQR
jgi:transposase-like protein